MHLSASFFSAGVYAVNLEDVHVHARLSSGCGYDCVHCRRHHHGRENDDCHYDCVDDYALMLRVYAHGYDCLKPQYRNRRA